MKKEKVVSVCLVLSAWSLVLGASCDVLGAAVGEKVRGEGEQWNVTSSQSANRRIDESKNASSKRPSFCLPEKIYAAPGIELNVYYSNVFDSVVPQNYAIQAYCAKGRSERTRWCWTPTEEDAGGQCELVINAWNDDGLVAAVTTTVVVAAAACDKAKEMTVALLGDSLTNSRYQDQTYRVMRAAGYSGYRPIGARAPATEGGVRYDGYGGFTFSTFLTRYAVAEDEVDNIQDAAEREQLRKAGMTEKIIHAWQRNNLKSPLVRFEGGKKTVDVRGWLGRINGGRPADVVIFELGVNSIFDYVGEEEALRSRIRQRVMPDAEKLFQTLRAEMPDALFLLCTLAPGASQDAFAANYGAKLSEAQHRKTVFALNREFEAYVRSGREPNLRLLPVGHAIDPTEGFIRAKRKASAHSTQEVETNVNAVHMSEVGGLQMGDAIAAMLQTVGLGGLRGGEKVEREVGVNSEKLERGIVIPPLSNSNSKLQLKTSSQSTNRRIDEPKNASSTVVGFVPEAGSDGGWAYRYAITKAWSEELPEWPSADLKTDVADWSGYDRLVIDVFNDAPGGDVLSLFIAAPTGRVQNGLSVRSIGMPDYDYRRWTIPLCKWPPTMDAHNVGRLHFYMTRPVCANVLMSGFYLLRPGEEPPPVAERFMREKIFPAREKARLAAEGLHRQAVSDFAEQCRAAGQDGSGAWIGRASSMVQVRPRADLDAHMKPAEAFSLSAARGEYASFQVVVTPNGQDLKGVRVEISELREEGGIGEKVKVEGEGEQRNVSSSQTTNRRIDESKNASSAVHLGSLPSPKLPSSLVTQPQLSNSNSKHQLLTALPPSAFKTSPVGYVQTVNPPPYGIGVNVATNLPGGYVRTKRLAGMGWWADPILDWLDRADVAGDDVQSFWVRFRCPEDARAGIYRGTLSVVWEGGGRTFPLTVRVYGFDMPKTSPLPLALTFSPAPHASDDDAESSRQAKAVRRDPESPVNAWKRHQTAWTDFLSDYFITADSLYHHGDGVHWEALMRQREQGRLGLFNLGYWNYPKDMTEAGRRDWLKRTRAQLDAPYAKAKELGLLEHAYLYGCDEVLEKYFENIRWAVGELKKAYPGVPLMTTAVDEDLGVGTPLAGIDWLTLTTTRLVTRVGPERIARSRAAGHRVWWYVACNQRAPYANFFVENPPIEARMLMGAQAAKWRPDGFLYYYLTLWNAMRPISGSSTFTDWDARSYRSYHGDGSLLCCGPDGIPCATVRIENFRDGIEDFVYAMLYEQATGKPCEMPPEVCRGIDQFTDDPETVERWRAALAEEIERNRK